MAHRDDVEALRARLEAQERELRDAKAELDVLRAAVHRDRGSDASSGFGAPFEGTDANPPAMGFGPTPSPLEPLRAATSRRFGLFFAVSATLLVGAMLMSAPCPSRHRRVEVHRAPAIAAAANATDAPLFEPFVRFARVIDPGTPAVLGAGEACAVEVTPVTDSSFDCRVVVRCGDRVLYGRDEVRGGTGYNHCGPVPSLIVDRDVTDDDGDPRLRVDLASGEVVVEEALGLGVQRVELALLDEE
jgi:hypothetical protein